MYTVLIVFYVLASVSLIGLVLIQHGKGADAGAAFGSGASGTVFGSRGSANFLSRATAWLAAVFFILSLTLAYIVHGRSTGRSVVDAAPAAAQQPAAPAVPDAAPAQQAPAVPPAEAPKSGAKPESAAQQPATPKVPD
jgi:preprotein translocase subunit SecG